MKKETTIITGTLINAEGSSLHMENTFTHRKLWYESRLFRYLMLSLNIFGGYKCIASEDPKKIGDCFYQCGMCVSAMRTFQGFVYDRKVSF